MELSEIARLNIQQNSKLYNTMIGNHLVSRLQQKETKADIQYKKAKKCNKKKEMN